MRSPISSGTRKAQTRKKPIQISLAHISIPLFKRAIYAVRSRKIARVRRPCPQYPGAAIVACCARAASGHAAAPRATLSTRAVSLPDASRASPERIAHLGTADCCIRPPGRYETIAITPPIIFSKEVAQNRPPHLPRQHPLSTKNRFTTNFRG
jgi:hypothetical protein